MTQQQRDRRLTVLWNEHWPTRTIAEKLGYTKPSSVRHAAKRLGLKARTGNRCTANATMANHNRRMRGEAVHLARLASATLKPVGPQPTLWRCEKCLGISKGCERHPHCVEAA